MLRRVRKRVAAAVSRTGPGAWLDICCGTGSQFRALGAGQSLAPTVGLDKSLGMVLYASARTPGRPFVCGDAARLPFKDGAFLSVTVSFGLHDKDPALREAMMREARRVLAPEGRFVAADFENPWGAKSKAGAGMVRLFERAGGSEHYRNGRDFLRSGGLRAFVRENGFIETERYDIEGGSLAVVVARPSGSASCGPGPDSL